MIRPPADAPNWVALTNEPLAVDALIAWATTPRAGAVVSFSGVVRDHAEGRAGVRAMTYEAYEEPATRAMHALADEVRTRWADVERIVIHHRVGDLELSEASVVIVVSAPHRGTAFAAASYAIDTLKQSVPIWKQEHWAQGSDWAVEQHPIQALPRS